MNRRLLLNLFTLLLMALPTAASALIFPGHEAGDSSERALQTFVGNTWKQQAFPFWMNVGRIDRSTGTYLGNGYVLTAAHVGVGAFKTNDGRVYQPIAGTSMFFKNHDGSTADLLLFRIRVRAGDPITKLPSVPLTTAPPKVGKDVLLLGAGAGGNGASHLGYAWTDDYHVRWGVNKIETIYTSPMNTSEFASFGYATKFNHGKCDCQAAPGDSGGAVFHFNPRSNRWELSGVIVAVDSDFGAATYGNQTYIADPALFRKQLAVAYRANGTLTASR